MARVVVYSTLICAYCIRAKLLLEQRGIAYQTVDVTGDRAARAELLARTGRRTVPQIFIDGRAIGGFHELRDLDRAGGLDEL